ncbi:MAG: methyltransferase domain-containing protein [Clostridia bacterium]|nr:methyltransferase domain-containing protein [Clostridia bacterium]MBP3588422.1 methyltransferase domain-containing protein [Clostridia bacterium]
MEHKVLDAAGFDAWQAKYDADVAACEEAGDYPFAGYTELHQQVFDIVHAREGVSVLDLGCGTGKLTARILEAGHPVTAVDFSGQMLQAAAHNAPGATFVQGELAQVPDLLAGQTFDCIIAVYALHHLPDAEKYALLTALREHLNPEGVIVLGDVSFPDRDGLEAVREAYEEDWDDSEFYLVREELEQALPQFDVDCIPISFCADVLILSPAE